MKDDELIWRRKFTIPGDATKEEKEQAIQGMAEEIAELTRETTGVPEKHVLEERHRCADTQRLEWLVSLLQSRGWDIKLDEKDGVIIYNQTRRSI